MNLLQDVNKINNSLKFNNINNSNLYNKIKNMDSHKIQVQIKIINLIILNHLIQLNNLKQFYEFVSFPIKIN